VVSGQVPEEKAEGMGPRRVIPRWPLTTNN